MRTSDLDYELPPGLIAQTAAEPRESARLLVYERASGGVRHRTFSELEQELRDDDLLVVNDTRVLPVRVRGRRSTGGAAELLLLEPLPGGRWTALGRPYRKLREGEVVESRGLRLHIRERLGEGEVVVELEHSGSLEAALSDAGEMPLPPYITTPIADPQRYQTVYADRPGSAAAPTAGLHFGQAMWRRLEGEGRVARVTLGVGLDTFRPVASDELEQHHIHSEPYAVAEVDAERIGSALREGRRVVAVGTTSVRVLETVFGERAAPLEGRTELFITPGFEFRATGALITNFHLPRSSLLGLVMAFVGVEEARELYRTAIEQGYRFYSLGDASLLL